MTETTLDNRGLDPPEPMVRILAAIQGLGEDDTLRVLMDREPYLIYRELERRGWSWTFDDEGGQPVLRIFHVPDGT